jgi:Mce-associated membrane protein
VADKNINVTAAAQDADPPADATAAAEAAGPEGTAQAEIGKSENGQAEIAGPEAAQPAPKQAEAGKSEIVQSEAAQSGEGLPGEGPPEAGAESGETAPGARRGRRTAAALGAATVILGGFGVWATLHANSLRSNAAAQNTALTDGPATAAVRREISAAVNTIFSYNYANTAATSRAAQGVLTGPAVRQYNTLFTLVTKNAPAQKLVVTTRVTNSGVELLNGNRARVLIFANQQDTRAGTGQTSYAGAMFAVTALRQGGRWKIENIDTFSG